MRHSNHLGTYYCGRLRVWHRFWSIWKPRSRMPVEKIMDPTMASTVSSVQHHSFGEMISCGTVAARCAPRDDTGSKGSRHYKTWHDQSVTLVSARKAKHGKSYLLQYTITVPYAGSRSCLPFESRQAIASPPAFSRADYCLCTESSEVLF
jgi:hypothetical protein